MILHIQQPSTYWRKVFPAFKLGRVVHFVIGTLTGNGQSCFCDEKFEQCYIAYKFHIPKGFFVDIVYCEMLRTINERKV